jgi:hypothetical protein
MNIVTKIFFPLLKICNFIFSLFSIHHSFVIVFSHPKNPYLMKKILLQSKQHVKNNSFYVTVDPVKKNWNEFISFRGFQLINEYYLTQEKNTWELSLTWKTFTSSLISQFKIDFNDSRQTVLTLTGLPSIINTVFYQSWFKYLKTEGIDNINIYNTVEVHNFGTNNSWKCEQVVAKCVEDFKDAIIYAKNRMLTIRGVGSLHSWTNINISNVLVDTSNLNKILSIDCENLSVEVEAGIKIDDLCKQLAEYNLTLINIGMVDKQSLAGVISTATHGTGLESGSFSSFVQEITFVDANCNFRKITREDDIFDAICTNLGCLCLIYSVKIRLQKLTNMVREVSYIDTNINSQQFNDIFFNPLNPALCFLFPFIKDSTQKLLKFNFRVTEQKITTNIIRTLIDNHYNPTIIQKIIYGYILPPLVKRSLWMSTKFLYYYYKIFYSNTETVDLSCVIRCFEPTPSVSYWEMEYGIPSIRAFEVYKKIQSLLNNSRYMSFLQLRTVGIDDQGLLNSSRKEPIVFFSLIYSYEHMEQVFPEMSRFEQIFLDYGGLPHWGKLYFDIDRIKNVHKDILHNFKQVRDELDPNDTFKNKWTQQFLNIL